jgi:prepilin-type N-terminal cleavage/methylation domain-containing protein
MMEIRAKRSVEKRFRRGFTLMEVIVVIALLGLLAVLILPAVQQARASARRVQCQNNQKQFGVALAEFAEVHEAFPTAQMPESCYRRLLPYFEQSNLLETIRKWEDDVGERPETYFIESFGCPDDSIVWDHMDKGGASYFFNEGTVFDTGTLNGFKKSEYNDVTPAEFIDGLSQTVAMSERLVRVVLYVG